MVEGVHPTKKLSARANADAFRGLVKLRQTASIGLVVALVIWVAVVVALGVLLAARTVGPSRPTYVSSDIATPAILVSASLVYLICLCTALITRRVRPVATLPVVIGTGGMIVVVGAITTGSIGELLFSSAFFVFAWLVGTALLHRLGFPPPAAIVQVPVAFALGLGTFGLLLFLLAAGGWLNAPTVLGSSGLVLLAVLVLDWRRLRLDMAQLRGWRAPLLTMFETIVLGLAVGMVAFAILTAFVPETVSDAIWQHLPIARELWQAGNVAEIPHLVVSKEPIQAHLVNAVAYGLGGITSIKLINTLVGLAGILGIGALGWLASGRVAAMVGAVLFGTMPLVLWLIGHALIDLFSVLFTITAVLSLMLWQRHGLWSWLALAGALAGFGLATKLNMAILIVAMGLGIVLVGRRPGQWLERAKAGIVFALGAAVFLPWLLRGYILTGTLSPKVAIVLHSLAAIWNPGSAPIERDSVSVVEAARQVYDPQQFNLGHSPLDLLKIPWFFTFHADEHRFLTIGHGEIGILLLALLPLVLLAPRNRTLALLGVTALVSYIGWAFSPFQIIRHLLPTLALAAALVGIAFASVVAMQNTRPRQILDMAAKGGMVVGLLVTPVFFLFGVLTSFPVDLFLGRETATHYLERAIPSAAAVQATTTELPPDTLVGYFGHHDGGPQIYTEARLIYVEPNDPLSSLGSTPEDVLASLDRLGLKYFIWNRAGTSPADWRSTLLSTEFLRLYTRILAGDRGGYLFEVVPSGGAPWGAPTLRNLLDDPGLKKVRKKRGAWETGKRPPKNKSTPAGWIKGSIAQQVSISGGRPYVVIATAKCADPQQSGQLTLRWLDEHGAELGSTTDAVWPGTAWSKQFLWHRAPEEAASAVVELSSWSRCDVDTVELFELP